MCVDYSTDSKLTERSNRLRVLQTTERRMSSKSKIKSKTRTPKKAVELQDAKIGFIGAGKMTESIINGLINFCKISPKKIFVAAPTEKNTGRFKEQGCSTTKRNIDIFAR